MVVTLQIGNTDNRLTQQEWAAFVEEVNAEVDRSNPSVHFFGAPPTTASWQNAAWVAEAWNLESLAGFKDRLTAIRKKYRQESVAFTIGQTEFI